MDYIKIPLVYQQTDNCIVMEYLDGVRLNEVQPADYETYARLVMKFGFITTIVHGFAHGDLHSGNILFMKDHKIGIIDFGIVFELTEEFRMFLFDLCTNLFEVDARASALALLDSTEVLSPPRVFQSLPKDHRESLLNMVTQMVEGILVKRDQFNQIQLYQCISELMNYLCHSDLASMGIRPSDNIVKSQFVLSMAHGVAMTLCRDNVFELAEQVMNEIFHVDLLR